MNFTLLPFQVDTVDTALRELRLSMDEVSRVGATGPGQAITLAAPTGAGKTVMAAAVLEALLFGDAAQPGDDGVTVVWLSDLPNVNEQTKQKIAKASDQFDDGSLITIDTHFSDPELDPGRIYFLNTQKLSAVSNLVVDSEDRSFTIWETINRTIERDPSKFILVIDEAHRGMERSAAADSAAAATIVQRFVLGSSDMERSPIILGISATPERFDELIAGARPRRTLRRAEADVSEVRASGLIKERIIVWRPEHGLSHSESTLLQRAAQSLQDYQLRWARYSHDERSQSVSPILVVQVEDKTQDQITATNLEQSIETIEEVLGPLHPDAFAHCFGDAPAPVIAGSRRIRYLRPSSIEADPQVVVVFFKTSLSTGWDCPRAEVIMSYRTAREPQLIAQLVGRMVRTPLAHRIDSDPVLNSVALYLPKYDRGAVQNIIRQLKAGDPEFMPATEAEEGDDLVTCDRVPALYEQVEAASHLPSFVVPRARRMAPVVRAERLAGALSDNDLLTSAPDDLDAKMLDSLWLTLTRRRADRQFVNAVEKARKVGLSATELSYLTGDIETTTIQVQSTSRSIERLFEFVGARVGAGLHSKLWRRIRSQDSSVDGETARLECIAVLSDNAALRAIDDLARDVFDDWIQSYRPQIDALPESDRHDFERLREQADAPVLRSLSLPIAVRSRRNSKSTDWPTHLFQDQGGDFPDDLNKWETDVVEGELAKSSLVCWVRNQERKSWALTVPYQRSVEFGAMFPDFLFFHDDAGSVAVDIIDPHGLHLDDAPLKARGLAKFAHEHGSAFRRIEMVIYDRSNERRKSLDLKVASVRRRVLEVTTNEHLAALFDLAGS